MKAIPSSDLEKFFDVPFLFVFTPFQDELTPQVTAHLSSFHVFDCSNKALVNRLNKLQQEEITFLFSQAETSLFIYADRLKSFRFLSKTMRENNLKFLAFGQSKLRIEAMAKEAGTEGWYFLLPCFSETIHRVGVFNAASFLSRALVYGMRNEVGVAFNPSAMPWLVSGKSHRINKPEYLEKMLVFLAMNSHKTLAYNEIGTWCGSDNETAQRYVWMLEDYGLVVPLKAYATGKKYEYLKGIRVGFLDNGVLNYYRNNRAELDFRADVMELWKNWIISELIKKDQKNGVKNAYFFWQSHTRQSMDLLVFSKDGSKKGYLILWKTKRAINPPPLFIKYYPDIPIYVINPSNYLTFLMP